MKWIYQLGDGNMLAYERGRVYRVNTGYPYPDTDKPQFDLLYELMLATGRYINEDDLKKNLKGLVIQFNKFFDANNNEGSLSDMLYYNDEKYTFIASSDYCDFYLCKYDSFIDSLVKSDLIDIELSSFDISDDMLLLIVHHSLRDKCKSKCDWTSEVGEIPKDFDTLFHDFWEFNEFYTDLDKFILLNDIRMIGLSSAYKAYKTKADFGFITLKVKKYIEKYHKNEFSFKLIRDMLASPKNYGLFCKCHLDAMLNSTFFDFNRKYDDELVFLFHDVEKHRLMSLLNYYLSNDRILSSLRSGTRLEDGLVQVKLFNSDDVDAKRIYNTKCVLVKEPLNKVPMYIMNQVVDFNDKGIIVNAKGLFGKYFDFLLISKTSHKINCDTFKNYLSMLGLNISDAKISKGKLLEPKFLFNNTFISSYLNRNYSHLAFLYNECNYWGNLFVDGRCLKLRSPFVFDWYDSIFKSIMPLDDFLNLNKDNFRYFVAYALAQNGAIFKDSKIVVDRLNINGNDLDVYYHLIN